MIIQPNGLVFGLDLIHEEGGAIATADEVLNLVESSVIILGIIIKTSEFVILRNPSAQIPVKAEIPIAMVGAAAAGVIVNRGGEEGGGSG